MNNESPIDPDIQMGDEDVVDRALRPEYLQDFVGQPKLKEQ
ncbi:MAG: Holliday junction resolvasome RuvABC ATP-dependent DNA helicase subunit, partial [Paracoccaceae bacterium]